MVLKKDIKALSSTDAEYISSTSGAYQAVWMRWLLKDMNEKQIEPTVIFYDNKSAIAITKTPTFHSRTKHIDTRFHVILNKNYFKLFQNFKFIQFEK